MSIANGVFDLSSLDGVNGFRLDGETTQSYTGISVSSAGDINGDGYDDILIGAPQVNYSSVGSSYVVFGKVDGYAASMDLASLDGSNGFRLHGVEAGSWSGISVSDAGDINGDGFDDLIIGAHLAAPNGNGSGSAYVVFGKAGGYAASINLPDLDGSNGFRLNGVAAGDETGRSVSGAGDINGDGYDDVIIGAHGADHNGSNSGSSYVVFGKAEGFEPTIILELLDGNNGFQLHGAASGDHSGNSVSSAGDVNGDGFDDLIIGDGDPFSGAFESSAYVVFGMSGGYGASINLGDLDGSNGFRMQGVVIRDQLGFSVSGAGDVNGDGYDDVIIGAHDSTPNGDGSGSSYVVFGKADSYTATVDPSSLDGTTGFRLDGIAPGDISGYSVSGAGDVNADGYDDLIIGSPGADYNGDNSGSSFLVYGKADGYAASLNLVSLNGSQGFRLDGEEALEFSGRSVSGAGDVNGDGFDDLIIGARARHFGPESNYVVFGEADESEDKLIEGGDAGDILKGSGGNDTIRGFGGQDILVGLPGDDLLEGGDDVDLAVYFNDRSDFTINRTEQNITVSGLLSDGHDTLIEVERLQFDDVSLAFDLDGNAGTIAKLLGVVLGKDSWHNKEYVGIGLDILDNSTISFDALMEQAFNVIIGPNPSNEEVVNLIYTNLIGQAPSQEELNTLVTDLLDSGAYTQGSLGVLAADHELNVSNIDLVGIAESGLEFFALG